MIARLEITNDTVVNEERLFQDAYGRIRDIRINRLNALRIWLIGNLEQALNYREVTADSLIQHSDRGSQYVSVAYTNRLNDAGVKPLVGTVSDSYDNALAETNNDLYKTELVYNLGPWKSTQALELATLNWVHLYNHERLLGTIGSVPPAEYENLY